MKITSNCTWDGIPCECHEFCSVMGIETYIYVTRDGKVLGGEIIDGEWAILDADEAREEYEYLTKED